MEKNGCPPDIRRGRKGEPMNVGNCALSWVTVPAPNINASARSPRRTPGPLRFLLSCPLRIFLLFLSDPIRTLGDRGLMCPTLGRGEARATLVQTHAF